MLGMLVYLVGHRARPSLAWRVALVLATTGSTRRRSPGRTHVGRLAVARDPRVSRLTLTQQVWRGAVLLATTIPVGGDEVPITLDMPTNVENGTHRPFCTAHAIRDAYQFRASIMVQQTSGKFTEIFCRRQTRNTYVFPEATRKDTGA